MSPEGKKNNPMERKLWQRVRRRWAREAKDSFSNCRKSALGSVSRGYNSFGKVLKKGPFDTNVIPVDYEGIPLDVVVASPRRKNCLPSKKEKNFLLKALTSAFIPLIELVSVLWS